MELNGAALLKSYPFNLLVDVNAATSAPDTSKIDLMHLPRDILLSTAYILYVLNDQGKLAIQLHYRDGLTIHDNRG